MTRILRAPRISQRCKVPSWSLLPCIGNQEGTLQHLSWHFRTDPVELESTMCWRCLCFPIQQDRSYTLAHRPCFRGTFRLRSLCTRRPSPKLPLSLMGSFRNEYFPCDHSLTSLGGNRRKFRVQTCLCMYQHCMPCMRYRRLDRIFPPGRQSAPCDLPCP